MSRVSEIIADVSFLDSQTAERLLNMARRRFVRKRSKYEDEAMLIKSTVTEILENNVEYPNGQLKNVFKCKSSQYPDGRLCILWGRSCIELGCQIEMKGRIVQNNGKDVFLAWSALIQKVRANE